MGTPVYQIRPPLPSAGPERACGSRGRASHGVARQVGWIGGASFAKNTGAEMMLVRRSFAPALLLLIASACAGLPGALRPSAAQPFAPPHARAPVVRTRVCGRDAVALPAGWRLPTANEVSDPWRRADPARFLLADTDLDGDGHPDQARLLLRTDGSEFGVFAFLCRDHGAIAPHLILHNRELPYFKVVGIKPVGPGRYRTACGRGFIDCYTGEPREVRLAHGGIDYFKNESVTSLFYWSPDVQAFRWVAIVD
jgi:hypothetical protein